MTFISKPMGWVLSQLSALLGNNFAASVLVFTILVNIIMLPLTLKSQKSMAKQARLKHKLDALKKKHGNDRQKFVTAQQDLYNREGISMGGGCMPMIVRLIIMMGVYWAIMSPFTYVSNINRTAINSASEWVSYVKVVDAEGDKAITDTEWQTLGLSDMMQNESIIAKAQKFGDGSEQSIERYAKLSIVNTIGVSGEKYKDDALRKKIKDRITKNRVQREFEITNYFNENYVDKNGKKLYEPIVVAVFEKNGGNVKDLNKIDFDLFGINLTEEPNFSWNFSKFEANWLIPISSFLAALLTGIITSKLQKKNNPEAPTMMAMMLIMPLFSLYIAFGFPCAVGFYWACSSLVSGGLQILTQLFYGPSVMNARGQAMSIVARASAEKLRMERIDNELNEQ